MNMRNNKFIATDVMSIVNKAFYISIVLFFTFSCHDKPDTMDLHVMSFNIRLDRDDGINSWPYRMPIVNSYLEETSPDIIGFQEPLQNQVRDLENMLDTYEWVGDGRNDQRKGESCPVFFKKEIFTLLDHDTFWLSETPEIPGSRGPGPGPPRIVTWVKLMHKESEDIVLFFNTHFSHVSAEARQFATEVMSSKMREIAEDHLLIALGDFNLRKDGDEYEFLTDHFGSNNSLINVEYIAEEVSRGKTTYNAYRKDREAIIDFIFVSEKFEASLFQVDEVVEDGVFISDHWPLRAIINHSN